MKELITLSRREAQRMQVLEQVVRKSLSLKAGAMLMKVCYRQAKRLVARYRREGPKGLAHRRRGQAAPNALGPEIRERVLALHREVYSQFNDTHFVEMLEEREGLRIGRETVRRWLREAGIRPKRRRRVGAGRKRLKLVAQVMVNQGLGHLRPATVGRAEKQDALLHPSFSLYAYPRNLSRRFGCGIFRGISGAQRNGRRPYIMLARLRIDGRV